MVNINLLPNEIIEKQKLQEIISLAIVGVIVVVLISAVVYISRLSASSALKKEVILLDKKLQELKIVVDEVEQLKNKKSTLEAKKQLVEQLQNNALIYPIFMSDLLKVLPDGVWLVSLNTSVNLSTERTIGSIRVNLNCNSYDKFAIADFISNLEQSPRFHDVKLGPINISQQDKYELHNFVLEFNYIPSVQQALQ